MDGEVSFRWNKRSRDNKESFFPQGAKSIQVMSFEKLECYLGLEILSDACQARDQVSPAAQLITQNFLY